LSPFTTGAHRASRRFAVVASSAFLALLLGGSGAAAATSTAGPTLDPDALPPIEVYVVNLINCNRSGGYVASDGRCIGYGTGRYSPRVPLIKLSWGISTNVSKPYARILAVRGLCGHNYDGDPGTRLREDGYRPSWWGENVGCYNNASIYTAVLQSHRAMQAEKSYNGGHWKNIKNRYFQYVGIGVYKYSGRVRLVEDFYRPA
jgi:hypothetical protein